MDYTPLRNAIIKISKKQKHGVWEYMSRQTGLSGSGIKGVAYGEGEVKQKTWEALYNAFPDEIPAPPWYKPQERAVKGQSRISGLGERLKAARNTAGLTQKEVATRLKIPIGIVSEWESGGSDPRIDYIIQLTDLYNVDAHTLLTGKAPEFDTAAAVMLVMSKEPNKRWTPEDVADAINQLIKAGKISLQLNRHDK